MKKFLAILLVLVLSLSLGITAFAANDYSITVTNTNEAVSIDGATYYAYKLFDVTYTDTDADGENDAFAYTISSDNYFYKNAKTILEDYFTLTESTTAGVYNVVAKDDYDARDFADEIQAKISGATAAGSAEAEDEEAVIELAAPGYYIITGSGNPTAEGREDEVVTAAVALDTTQPDVEINAKLDAPDVDKSIVGGETKLKGTTKNIGDVITYQYDSKVPVMTGYDEYTFVMSDTMTSGLTFNNDVAVTIGGEDYEDFTVAFDSTKNSFTVTFNDFIEQAENAGDAIVVTYTATLNENALKTGVEENTVTLEYSNNPYDDTTNHTPEHKTYVYDFTINIDKYDAKDDTKATKLKGAEFVLYKVVADDSEEAEEGDTKNLYYKWDSTNKETLWVEGEDNATVVVTDENGAAAFKGVEAGSYMIHETKAPAGYNPLEEDINVTITATLNDDGTMKSTNTEIDKDGQYSLTTEVGNNSGTILPSTGGIGTTLFYIVGGLAVAAAVILLISKKRVSAK